MKKLIKALEKKGFFSEALQVRRVVSESIFNVKDILDNVVSSVVNVEKRK